MLTFSLIQRILVAAVAAITLTAAPQSAPATGGSIPRTVDGKPNLQGIWQASSTRQPICRITRRGTTCWRGGRL